VTFSLPAAVSAASAHLCGEFNDWSPTALPMHRLDDGGFEITVRLPMRGRYRFRYLLDDERWVNDWAADGYVPNGFGGEDSLVVT